jgi:hypothetical protein
MKPKRHPKSLMKDNVSNLRYLTDKSDSIFNIIMPWRQEKEDEERKRMKKIKKENELKQASLSAWVKPKPSAKPANQP